jgi:hypothetical protein
VSLSCPICRSRETKDMFASIASDMPPALMRSGVIESIPDDGRLARALLLPAVSRQYQKA